MKLFKVEDVNFDKMTIKEKNEYFWKEIDSYYEKYFQNCNDINKAVSRLFKISYSDMWNAYIAFSYLEYCTDKFKSGECYTKKLSEETKKDVDFYSENFYACFCLYVEILDRLLKVAEKLNVSLKDCSQNV